MRVLDMRLTVLVTLILLGAAMPANCAEVPTVWFGLAGRACTTCQPSPFQRGLLTFTIQDAPKRSLSMPNRSAQNVSPIGITT